MDLTTVAHVKRFLGLDTVKYDELLKMLVESISIEAADEMQREPLLTTYTEFLETQEDQRLYRVKAWPISDINSLKVDPEGTFPSSSEVSPDYYGMVRDGARGEIQFHGPVEPAPTGMKIVYSGGMTVDTASFTTAYADIAWAVTRQVAYIFSQRNQQGETSVSSAGASISLQETNGFLPDVYKILRRHSRV